MNHRRLALIAAGVFMSGTLTGSVYLTRLFGTITWDALLMEQHVNIHTHPQVKKTSTTWCFSDSACQIRPLLVNPSSYFTLLKSNSVPSQIIRSKYRNNTSLCHRMQLPLHKRSHVKSRFRSNKCLLHVIIAVSPETLSCLTLKRFCRQIPPPDGTNDTELQLYSCMSVLLSAHQHVLPHPYLFLFFFHSSISHESPTSLEADGKYEFLLQKVFPVVCKML